LLLTKTTLTVLLSKEITAGTRRQFVVGAAQRLLGGCNMAKLIFSEPKRHYAGRDLKGSNHSENVNATMYLVSTLLSLFSVAIFFPKMTSFDGYQLLCGLGLAAAAILQVIVNAHDLFAVMIRESQMEDKEKVSRVNGHISTMYLVASCLSFNGSLLALHLFQSRINRTGLWQRVYSSVLSLCGALGHLAKTESFGSTKLQIQRNGAVLFTVTASALNLSATLLHFKSGECTELFHFGSILAISGGTCDLLSAVYNFLHVRRVQELEAHADRQERKRKLAKGLSDRTNGSNGFFNRLLSIFSYFTLRSSSDKKRKNKGQSTRGPRNPNKRR